MIIELLPYFELYIRKGKNSKEQNLVLQPKTTIFQL